MGLLFLTSRIISAGTLSAIPALFTVYWLFNLFHFDGFLDSADGIFYQGSRERRLEIMKDSRLGTYALFCGVFYLIAKVLLLGSIYSAGFGPADSKVAVLGLLFFPVVGRAAASVLPLLTGPARNEGLAAMTDSRNKAPVFLGLLFVAGYFTFLTAVLGFSISQAFILAGYITVAFALSVLIPGMTARVRLGGYTGDTLGAAVETGEIMTLTAVYLFLGTV